MAYFIEMAQDPTDGFYLEIAFVDIGTGDAIPGTGVDHQLVVYPRYDDFGGSACGGIILASNSNGLITNPATGVVAINIPPSALRAFVVPSSGDWEYGSSCAPREALRCRLLAVPSDPDFTKVLAKIDIYLGGRVQTHPRVMEGPAPIYPNWVAFTADSLITADSSLSADS